MAQFKKLRAIYRILFPKKRTASQLFESRLQRIPHIVSFKKGKGCYEVVTASGTAAVIRDERYSDWLVFEQIFSRDEYGIVLGLLLHNHYASSPVTIIDAGANVGYTTMFFSENLDAPRIFAVEPSAENAAIFRRNAESLPNASNIVLYEKALSPSDGDSFSLDRNFRDGKDWSIVTEPDPQGGISGISVSGIIDEQRLESVTLLKIDIEGAERFIFNEGGDLSFLDKVKVICLEIHDEFDIRQTIYSQLRDRGFVLIESGESTIGLNKKFL